MQKKHKIIIILILTILILIQFIPVDSNNPPIEATINWDSDTTKNLFYRACADCHSNETRWPWYSKIAPVSFLISYDVNVGRKHFNISVDQEDERNESAREVRRGTMPMPIYILMHKEADLNAAEKKQLIQGLINTFGDKDPQDLKYKNQYK
jgi:hypothetical protein